MVFYKKTGTLPSPLAARWCICCFQLAWWHPFSGSRCCPLLHGCNSGITPLTSVKWLQIYPRWKQNWTTVFLFAYLLGCSPEGASLPYRKGKASACLLCRAQLFVSWTSHSRAWQEQKSGWCGACVLTRFPMEQLLVLDSWLLSHPHFHQLPLAWICFPRRQSFLS